MESRQNDGPVYSLSSYLEVRLFIGQEPCDWFIFVFVKYIQTIDFKGLLRIQSLSSTRMSHFIWQWLG